MSAVGDFSRSLVGFLAPGAAVVGAAALVSAQGGARVGGAVWLSAAAATIVAQAASDRRARGRAEKVARKVVEVAPLSSGLAVAQLLVGAPPAHPTPPAA